MAMVPKPDDDHHELAVRRGTNYYDFCRCGQIKKVGSSKCKNCRKRELRALDIQTQDLILRHLAMGLTLPKTARALHMQGPMVWNYWRRIMKRFQTRSPFKIALLAKQAGILEVGSTSG